MKKWEYKFVEVGSYLGTFLFQENEELDKLGADGWEMISAIKNEQDDKIKCVLKKEAAPNVTTQTVAERYSLIRAEQEELEIEKNIQSIRGTYEEILESNDFGEFTKEEVIEEMNMLIEKAKNQGFRLP